MKTCSVCGKTKEAGRFHQHPHTKDRRSPYCKDCDNAARRKRRAEDTPDKQLIRAEKKAARDLLKKQGLKYCPHCKTAKPFSEFFKHQARNCGFSNVCKPCDVARGRKNELALPPGQAKRRRLAYTLRSVYGIELEDYEQIRMNQQNRCAICKEEFLKSPHVDHDHMTGKVRGLLCTCCNISLGGFRDSPERLIAAASYLQKTS